MRPDARLADAVRERAEKDGSKFCADMRNRVCTNHLAKNCGKAALAIGQSWSPWKGSSGASAAATIVASDPLSPDSSRSPRHSEQQGRRPHLWGAALAVPQGLGRPGGFLKGSCGGLLGRVFPKELQRAT